MAACGAGMSEGWERRLAAAVLARAFEDVLAPEPGSRRLAKLREDRNGLAKRREWRHDRDTATAFLYAPEFEAARRHWFAQAALRLPATVEAMTARIQDFARGGPELPVDSDEDGADFEEPAIEEPVDFEDEEAA